MIYAFEEIGPDLSRPPLAARRALLASGVAVPLEAWQALGIELRQRLVFEGTRPEISEINVKNAVSTILKRVRFIGALREGQPANVPPAIANALQTIRPVSNAEWVTLRPLDRYALTTLASNSRLLFRAIEELSRGVQPVLAPLQMSPWVGTLAHGELRVNTSALSALASGQVAGGKALILARVAGVRAARRAPETLDGYADKVVGPVELDARLEHERGVVIWQAHVSTIDGEFFAAGSMVAASVAAVALRDLVASIDPHSAIGDVALRDEPWSVGNAAFGEEATAVIGNPVAYLRTSAPPPSRSGPVSSSGRHEVPARTSRGSSKGREAVGFPAWIVIVMMVTTLLSLAAAVVALARK